MRTVDYAPTGLSSDLQDALSTSGAARRFTTPEEVAPMVVTSYSPPRGRGDRRRLGHDDSSRDPKLPFRWLPTG